MSDDLLILHITHRGTNRLHIQLAAATRMYFDVLITGHNDYDKLIADICEIAPVMMRYDVDMAEAFDDGFRTQPQAKDRAAINFFVRKYRDRIKDARVGFGEFAELEQEQQHP